MVPKFSDYGVKWGEICARGSLSTDKVGRLVRLGTLISSVDKS